LKTAFLEGVLRPPLPGKREGRLMSKNRFVFIVFIFCGLVFLILMSLFTSALSAENKVEIKKEVTKDQQGKTLVQCWSRPKPADNKPNFFKGLEKITNSVIDFTPDNLFGNSIAFLVGVSKYKYLSPQLPFVENDLEELANSLLLNNGFDTVYIVKMKLLLLI
jgi:hypothetical protein